MKRFVIRIVVFVLLVVAIIGGICTAEIVAEVKAYHEELKAPAGSSVLLCNDSQLGNSVNPSICPEFFNFCAHGRTLDQSYLVMKDALDRDVGKRIRTVVFDVSPAAPWGLDDPLDKMGFPAKYWLIHYLHRRENIRDLRGGLVVARDNLVGRRLRLFWRAVRGVAVFKSSLIGSYTFFDQCDKRDAPARFKGLLEAKVAQCEGMGNLTVYSPFCIKVLDKVVACARTHGVRLVLVTSPWHPDLLRACGRKKLSAFASVMRSFAERERCDYVDLLSLPLDESCWLDANHLNAAGAKVFTPLLKERLKGIGAL